MPFPLLTTLVIANWLLRHFCQIFFSTTEQDLFISSPYWFLARLLLRLVSVFLFSCRGPMSVRWCFIFLKITPLPAPYASDGLSTLHWLSWLNNLGQTSWPKHTHPLLFVFPSYRYLIGFHASAMRGLGFGKAHSLVADCH